MKVIGVVTLVLSIAAMLSYGPGVPTQDISTGYNSQITTLNNTIAPVSSVNGSTLNPPHGQPGHRCDIRVGQPLNSKPIAPKSNFIVPAASILPITPADGLNPKHGQPGHRCDIAVGQPLNSEPTLPAKQTANTITSAVTTAANTTKAPLLNPKHGQPFHRCDIMVGQPLNSKPTLPPMLQNASNTPSSVVTPLRTAATAAPLLNPKHGQPGHRCDVLAGQPLNGKPAFTLSAK
jgi:hypothetical protein